MLSSILHECPRCTGAIDRENFATESHEDHRVEFLYCEFCGYGTEVIVGLDGELFPLDYQHRTEPREFAKFLDRLEAARAAA